MRRRAYVGILAAVMAVTTGAGVASATDDGSSSSELAEAQFRVYLLTHTDLRPSDITCTLPPTQDSGGEMVCFALVGRESIAAVATLTGPGTYRFTAITKAGALPAAVPEAPAPQADPQADPGQNAAAADAAVLDAVSLLVDESDPIAEELMSNNESIVSVEPITFDEITATVSVTLTTDATAPDERNFTAFDVTNLIAFLWETDWPLRDPAATIQPRAEVIVDGEIYGTPYDVMVMVADYDIGYEEWLTITTTAGTFRRTDPASALAARAEQLRGSTSAPAHAGLLA